MRQLNEKVFEEFPVLKTDRLTMRDIRLDDAKEIYEMRSNGRVNEFIPRPNMESLEQSEALIQQTIKAYENKKALGWAGILRDGNVIIGTCGFNSIEWSNLRAEIGGELATEFWGKGIALEAVKGIITFGFKTLGLHTIEAKVAPENRGSVHILEHLGFVKEAHYRDRGIMNGKFLDMAVYTLFEDAWKMN